MSDQPKPTSDPVSRITHLTDCPKCGTSNPPDTRYCEHCGASLAVAAAAVGGEVRSQKKQGFLARLLHR